MGTDRKIKGVVVVGLVQALRTWRRDRPAARIDLSPSAQRLLERRILASSWYDYDAYLELMTAAWRSMLDQDRSALEAFIKAGTRRIYGDAHKALIDRGDPAHTVHSVPRIWSLCHTFGRASVTVDGRTADVTFEGLGPLSELETTINVTWIAGVLEMAGARDVRSERLPDGVEGSLQTRFSWRPPSGG